MTLRPLEADAHRHRSGAVEGFHSTSYRCLLDMDVELADELDPEVRRVARAAATALTFDADPGELPLADPLRDAARGLGVLVVDGIVAQYVKVGDRLSAELLGAGDLLQPPFVRSDQLLAPAFGWQSISPVRIGLLDEAFARQVRFWPQIAYAMLRRAARRHHSAAVQRAIAMQPRLEIRLALLFWHLAERWGRVERGGVGLSLPLTHQLLGRLAGAERPSVSHALARLAEAGLITGHGSEWHLHGSLQTPPAPVFEADVDRFDQIVAWLDAGGRRPAHRRVARA